MSRTLPLLLLSTSLCDLLKGPYGDGSASDTDPGSTSEATGDADDDDGMTLPTGEPTTGQYDPEPVCLMNTIVGSTDGNFLELCEVLVDPHDGGVVVVGAFEDTLEIQDQSAESKPDQRAIFVARFAASGVIEWIESFDEPGLLGCKDAVLTAAGDVAIVDADTPRILVLRASAKPRSWQPTGLAWVPSKIEMVGDDILLAGSCESNELWLAIVNPESIAVKEHCEVMPGVIPTALAVDPNTLGAVWVGATQPNAPALIARVNLSPLGISDIQGPEDISPPALSAKGATVYSLEYSKPFNYRVRLRSYPPGAGPGLAEIDEGKILSATDMTIQGDWLVFALETDDESGSTVDLWRVAADDFEVRHKADIAGEPKWSGPPILTASPTASPCGVLFGGSRNSSPEPFTVEGAEVLAPHAHTSFFVTRLPPNFGE